MPVGLARFGPTSTLPAAGFGPGESRRAPSPGTPGSITLADQGYQPPKAEREKEQVMPGTSMETVRTAFFRAINVRREPAD